MDTHSDRDELRGSAGEEMEKGRGPADRLATDAPEGIESENAERPVGGVALGASTAAVTGAAIGGVVAGPIGLAIGALAGGIGGWWAGKGIATSLQDVDGEDTHFRTHYETLPTRPQGVAYEDVRPAYHLGGLAARNPAYRGRSFDEVETDLRQGWTPELETRHGAWTAVRDFASAGFNRSWSEQRAADGAGATIDASGEPVHVRDVSGTPDVELEAPHHGAGRTIAGGAAGATAGALAGGMVGTVILGPIGTALGALAGIVGGGWVGAAVGATADQPVTEHDDYYRTHYEASPRRLADRAYEDARPAYHLGGIAAGNPDYAGRAFEDVEGDLRHGWTPELQSRYGDWSTVRDFARTGYLRNVRVGGNVRERELQAASGSEDVAGTDSLHKSSVTDRVVGQGVETIEEGEPRIRE